MPHLVIVLVALSLALLADVAFRHAWHRYQGFRAAFIGRAARDLDYLYFEMQADRLLVLTITLMVFLGGVALAADLPPIVVVGLVALGYAGPRATIRALRQRRARRFDEQLVEAISMIASSLHIGLNLHNAIRTVAVEMGPPISQEFGLVLREMQLGASIEGAMEGLARRMESEDLNLMVTAIAVAHQTGGDLGEIFENIAVQIRERRKIQGKIWAMTTAGRLQGLIVAMVPPFLFLWTVARDGDRVTSHYAAGDGMMMLGAVAVLYMLAFVSIRRILQVEL